MWEVTRAVANRSTISMSWPIIEPTAGRSTDGTVPMADPWPPAVLFAPGTELAPRPGPRTRVQDLFLLEEGD